MKEAALATMGTSPPVITEFVEYMNKLNKLENLTILSTNDKQILNGATLAKIAIEQKYPQTEVNIYILPVSDITNEEENYLFMEHTVKIISNLRKRYKRIHICLAGGRKEMVASTMLIAQLTGINTLYHIVSPNIKEMNIELERIRKEIEELAQSSNPTEYYNNNKEKFDKVMFPPSDSYNVIKLPIIPYPWKTLLELHNIMTGGSVRKTEKGFLDQLKYSGLITITKQGKIILTDEGKKLYQHVIKHML